MTKEIVISVIIIILIFIGNWITEDYTKQSIEETTKSLEILREEIIKNENEINLELIKTKMNDIYEKWSARHEKLAYFIEHDELEKAKTELIGLKGYIEKEEYSEAVPELDRSVYILEHIKEKTVINLKNIF